MDCSSGKFSNETACLAEDMTHDLQIWGFEELQQKRMFVRRIVVSKDEQVERVKLIYDFESS